MTILLSLALKQKGKVTVLDFGGALGGTSAQHLPLLRDVVDWKWMVVERPHFVEIGKRHFASENLQFYQTVEEAVKNGPADLLLLSSVIQYLPEPWAF